MSCPACGAGVTPELRFCLACGTPLARACGTCGTPIVPGARFCGQCGTRVADAPAPGMGHPSATAPAGPTPTGVPIPQLERRLVSVLFADLVGFTTRSESRDPEAVREFLTRYFQAAADVIARYGGTVEKFIGDAVMAVWGTPTTFEDDAERAVRAALELVDAVRRLPFDGGTDEIPSDPLDRVDVRAAVMTGDAAVTVGATGQGMVAGDLVNSAARLQSAAAPGVVLVDEATVHVTDQAIAYEPAGVQTLRGKVAPVPAWAALRVVAERGGAGRTSGLEAPFVEREEELRLLKDQLHAAGREGRARLVTVLGEAGMGKSRLVWEFLKYIDGVSEDIWWHEGRSLAYGEGVAYWALGEMVRRRAGIVESEDEATARPKLTATIARFVPDAAEQRWIEPRLAALLGLTAAPPGDREELFAAWRTFFERISAQGTVVLVFEDLHWADDGLLDFIESLLEWSRSRPILVLALARPSLLERRPGWGRASRASITLHLDPVRADGMSALLAGLAPGLPADAIARITERAEGVPLFAVETVRMLLDEGRLVREGERFRLIGADEGFAAPPSLQALIAARLDALGPADRGLLMTASVLGRTFSIRALAAVAEQDPAEVENRLRGLARKELVAPDTDPRSPEHGQVGFVHGLVREVAYGMLSRRDKRALHLAAARHFEAMGDEELAGILASYYLDAWRAAPDGAEGDVVAAQARTALRAAAERALALHADQAALRYLVDALTVTTDPAERAATQLRASRAGQDLEVEVTWAPSAESLARDAMAWFSAAGDTPAADRAAVQLARVLILDSRTAEARELLAPVFARIDDRTAGAAEAAIANQYARSHLFDSLAAEALAIIERGLHIAEQAGAMPEMIDLLISKTWALSDVGRPREGAIVGLGGLELAERLELAEAQLRARMNVSAWFQSDDPQRGLDLARDGVAIAERFGMGAWAANLAGNGGNCALLTGDWDLPLRWEETVRPGSTVFSRFALLEPAALVRALRSGTPALAEHPVTHELQVADVSAQDRSTLHAALAGEAWAAGRLDEVSGHAVRALGYSMLNEAKAAMVWAGRAALWRGSSPEITSLLDQLRRFGAAQGAWLETAMRTLDAAARLLAGEPAGVEAVLRENIETMRRMRLRPEIAEEILILLRLLPDVPDATSLAAEAGAIIDELRAVGMRRRLDQLAPSPVTQPA